MVDAVEEDGRRRDGVRGADGRRPADVYLPCWRVGRPVALDFAASSGLRVGSLGRSAIPDAGQLYSTAAAEDYAGRKRAFLNTEVHCNEEGFDFVAMVVEASGGGWTADARRVWYEIARTAARLTGDLVASKLEQYHQALPIPLHRANAIAIHRRTPVVFAVSPAVAAAEAVLLGARADQAVANMLLDGQ